MPDINVRTERHVEPDDGPDRFNRRRAVRVVTVLILGILAVLAVWQDPLYAGF